MEKFIQITDTSGRIYTVNAHHILYLKVYKDPILGKDFIYHVEIPGCVISVTEQMFNKIKSQIQIF